MREDLRRDRAFFRSGSPPLVRHRLPGRFGLGCLRQAQLDLGRKQEALDSLKRRIEEDFGLVQFEYEATMTEAPEEKKDRAPAPAEYGM